MFERCGVVSGPGELIRNVHTVLVRRVEPHHQHGSLDVLLVYRPGPQPSLQGPEGRGHAVHLVVGEHGGVGGHVVADGDRGLDGPGGPVNLLQHEGGHGTALG